jgi:hypothetical protein
MIGPDHCDLHRRRALLDPRRWSTANPVSNPSTSAGNSHPECNASQAGTDSCRPAAAATANATGRNGSPSVGRTHCG